DAVYPEPVVPLELHEGVLGEVAKAPVDLPHRIAEGGQLLLELAHVLSLIAPPEAGSFSAKRHPDRHRLHPLCPVAPWLCQSGAQPCGRRSPPAGATKAPGSDAPGRCR